MKMRRILDNKKDAIQAFDKRSKIILEDHLKLKEKIIRRESVDSE